MGKNKYLRNSTSFISDGNNLNSSRVTKNSRRSLSAVKTNEHEQDPNDKLFETLMNDPIKRALVLQILSQNENNTGKHDHKNEKTLFRKVKKCPRYESPTSLFRRKQLQQLEKKRDGSETSSNCSDSNSESNSIPPPKVPQNELLKGLIMYVEICSKGEDKSAVAKALVKAMGGTVRDEFTKDVTHVIFKDGSYDTYQKAKLSKVFLVSILWLEAVKKNHCVVPENEYPAFSITRSNADMSLICEQMQKEFEEIVNEEYNRSKLINTSNRSPRKSRPLRESKKFSSIRKLDFQNNSRLQDDNEKSSDTSIDASDDSNCGVINGSAFKNHSRKNVIDDSTNNDDTNVRKSNSTTPSFSLILQKNRSNYEAEAMDMTSNIAGNVIIDDSVKNSNGANKSCKISHQNSVCEKTGSSLVSTDISTNISKSRNSKNHSNSLHQNNTHSVNEDELPPLQLSTTTSTDISSNRNSRNLNSTNKNNKSDKNYTSENNTEMPPLRLSSDTSATSNVSNQKRKHSLDNSTKKDDNVLKESFLNTTNKKNAETKKRTTLNVECTPEKVIKLVDNDAFVTIRKSKKIRSEKTKQKRRLINLDDDFNIDDADENIHKGPVSSVFLTPSAKKYLEQQRQSNKNCDSYMVSSKAPKKPTQENRKERRVNNDQEINEEIEGRVKDTYKSQKNKTRTETPSRKSLRISRIGENKNENVTITPIKRRSTLDFEQCIKNKKKHSPANKTSPTIVCTRLHNPDVQVFEQIVSKLGNFEVEDEVSSRTTHLVAGECKRTVNILRAIARGCWILKHEWLLKSLEKGKWLPEDDYELVEFSPAVQKCRKERQAFGASYSSDIFLNCGYIYICKSSTPRCSDLKELVQLCNGKVTTILRNASIIIGEYIKKEGVICVKETWLLDSITFNKKKSFKNYLLKSM